MSIPNTIIRLFEKRARSLTHETRNALFLATGSDTHDIIIGFEGIDNSVQSKIDSRHSIDMAAGDFNLLGSSFKRKKYLYILR